MLTLGCWSQYEDLAFAQMSISYALTVTCIALFNAKSVKILVVKGDGNLIMTISPSTSRLQEVVEEIDDQIHKIVVFQPSAEMDQRDAVFLPINRMRL